MPIKKEPIIAKCFGKTCQKEILIKFVPPLKNYSKKHDWDYWTQDPKKAGMKICEDCLTSLYFYHKQKLYKNIPDKKFREVLRKYVSRNRKKLEKNTPWI